MCAPATPQDLAASLLDLFFNLDGFRVALGNFTHSQGACLFPLYLNLPGPSSSRDEIVLTEVLRLTTLVDSHWNERRVFLLDPSNPRWTPRPFPRTLCGTVLCGAGPSGCTNPATRRMLRSTTFQEVTSLGTPPKS